MMDFHYVASKLDSNFSPINILDRWEQIALVIVADAIKCKMSSYLQGTFSRFELFSEEDLPTLTSGDEDTASLEFEFLLYWSVFFAFQTKFLCWRYSYCRIV